MLSRLRQARRDTRLTQAEVGRRLGQPQSFLSKAESRERRIDAIELARFAAIYGKSLVSPLLFALHRLSSRPRG